MWICIGALLSFCALDRNVEIKVMSAGGWIRFDVFSVLFFSAFFSIISKDKS